MARRKRDTGPACGRMTFTISQPPRADVAKFDRLTVNKCHDGELCEALARRGYDVDIRVPSGSALASRRKKFEAKKRRREAERAKGGA